MIAAVRLLSHSLSLTRPLVMDHTIVIVTFDVLNKYSRALQWFASVLQLHDCLWILHFETFKLNGSLLSHELQEIVAPKQ